MSTGEWHPHITVNVHGDGLNAAEIADLIKRRMAEAQTLEPGRPRVPYTDAKCTVSPHGWGRWFVRYTRPWSSQGHFVVWGSRARAERIAERFRQAIDKDRPW